MKDKLLPIRNGLEIKQVEDKLKFTRAEKNFYTYYAETFHKQDSMKRAGLNIKRNGEEYGFEQLIKRANKLLSYPSGKLYITQIIADIKEQNFLTLEKTVNLTFRDYEEWRTVNRKESNVAMDRLCKLLGYMDNGRINVNTQIVASEDGGITINYNQPDEKNNKDKDETN